MQKWEYLFIDRGRIPAKELSPNEWPWGWEDGNELGYGNRLNQLGSEGWELINAIPLIRDNSAGRTDVVRHIFKRPIP